MTILWLSLMIDGQKAQNTAPAATSTPTVNCVMTKSDKPAIRNVDKSGKCPAGEKPLTGPDGKTVMSCLGKEHPKPVCTTTPAK